MKRFCACLTLWILASVASPVPAAGLLALTHVTVIRTAGGPPQPDMVVLISDGRIVQLGPAGRMTYPLGAQIVDASGQFLIPGLWDMHTHVLRDGRPAAFFPLLIANGVTGIRDMGAAPSDSWRTARDRANGGLEVAPRIVASGPILDGPRQASPLSIAVSDVNGAREAVKRLKTAAVDFIKVYSLLPRPVFFAIAEAAGRLKIPFAGHVPYSVSIQEAASAGQKSIEHLSGYLLASSTDETELRRQLIHEIEGPNAGKSLTRLVTSQIDPLLRSYSAAKADTLATQFARNRTWHCPTLVTLRAFAFADDPALATEPNLQYVPASMRARWQPGGHLQAGHSAREFEDRRRVFEKELELTGRLLRATVPLLAGTDSPAPNVVPGFSLHDELELLVRAGLSPLQALQAATIQPARFLGMQSSSGTVERGKRADLVLLEANPLVDIRNTRRIAAVILNGKLLVRQTLQQMLDKAKTDAARR